MAQAAYAAARREGFGTSPEGEAMAKRVGIFLGLLLGLIATEVWSLETPRDVTHDARAEARLALIPEKLWSAEDGLHEGWIVLIEGKHIAAVGPAAQLALPADIQKIELKGMTLLPGLIDLHTH